MCARSTRLPNKPLCQPQPRYPVNAYALCILLQTLQIDQLVVPALTIYELIVRPALHYPALVEDVDHIRLLDRAQAMGDSYSNIKSQHKMTTRTKKDSWQKEKELADRRPSLRRSIKRSLHNLLTLTIQRTRRLV